MIRAEVKSISTLEGSDLQSYVPVNPESFCIPFRIMVGPMGGPGSESFDILVCTPKWLAQVCEKDGFVVGRHHLIVSNYNYSLLSSTIKELVEHHSGDTWREVAEKVGRIGYWEFEDYRDRG